jgi:hypothetical protein
MDGSGPAAIFPFHFDSLVMWGPSSTYTASYTFFHYCHDDESGEFITLFLHHNDKLVFSFRVLHLIRKFGEK